MKLVIFAPTGIIGSRILNEALSRGHIVTAITRELALSDRSKIESSEL